MVFTVLILLTSGVTEVAVAASSATLVNCQACHQVTWPKAAWECDVRCNLAPTGVNNYGKNLKPHKYW